MKNTRIIRNKLSIKCEIFLTRDTFRALSSHGCNGSRRNLITLIHFRWAIVSEQGAYGLSVHG